MKQHLKMLEFVFAPFIYSNSIFQALLLIYRIFSFTMKIEQRKIINDPVYGFITLDSPLVFDIISHPWYQRLRRIHQMALASFVYPGAVHTRFHHSLGAYHLMCQAVSELCHKGVDISEEESEAVKAAILLHDIGHGPYSHALENLLVPKANHEEIGLQIMHRMNEDLEGRLSLAIDIFTNVYPKYFLHSLISGQVDVDRMDYLTRDSFYTGVSEGVIGYDRILKMLAVHNGELMIEEKAIYSTEKFLVARRQMYWQVYLHRAVLATEMMLVKIIERVKEIYKTNDKHLQTGSPVDLFLAEKKLSKIEFINAFCSIDDADVLFAVKQWSHHKDVVLSVLSNGLLNRNLLKCTLQNEPVAEATLQRIRKAIASRLQISEGEAAYLAFTGVAENTAYKLTNENVNILFKNGEVKDISQVDDPLINQTLSLPVKKFYICQLR